MYARYLNAPLLLLVWQVAPVDIRRDDSGRVRVGITAGRGAFSFRDYAASPGGVDCNGDSYPSEPARTITDTYQSVGISAEVRAGNSIRLLAALGDIESGWGERHGKFGAAQAVYEREDFGLGLGLASFGGFERSFMPSASIRVGSLSGVALRADYRHPEPGMGLIGGPRIGVAVNQGESRQVRAFFGVATTPVPDSARRVGGYVELALPLGFLDGRGGLSLNAFVGPTRRGNENKQIFSFGIGAYAAP